VLGPNRCFITGFNEKMIEDKKTPEEMTDDEFIQYARENVRNKEFRNNREYVCRLASLWRRFL
jgi:hypothetical protein